ATSVLLNGQTVTVKVTNASGCFATSTGIATVVNANPVASLVSNDSDNIICVGTSVSFTATPTAATYDFRKNTVSVQNSASGVYTTTGLVDTDVIDVIVTTGAGCSSTSAGITMTVNG